MASPLTHAVVAGTIAAGYRFPSHSLHVWLGVACAEFPDIDVIGFWLNVPYEHLFGHRGITHSILFAVLFSGWLAHVTHSWCGLSRARLWSYLFLATLSHGVLDALTDGGLGVAFFAPFDETRYFFPFHPIKVTPLEVTQVLGPAGLAVLLSEAMWVWLPCVLIVAGTRLIERSRNSDRKGIG